MQFDQIIDRKDEYSYKWEKYKGKDILPMWVADSEFRCAEPILEALKARVEHGILGYNLPAQYEPGKQAITDWLARRHQWQVELDWIVWVPGVVPAFNMAAKAYCEPGDKVLVQTPNYPPMLAAPKNQQLERLDVPTVEVDGRWTLDFDTLEALAEDPKCKLFIMCNPMNPVGSVMTAEELERVSQICQRHGVTLCSDEIHCDLILEPGITHVPAGKVAGQETSSITLMAASKTFNIAGLGAAFAIIPDSRLRAQFVAAGAGMIPWVNSLGLIATEAAFTQCDDWYDAQLAYLRDNRDYLVREINQIPGLRLLKQDATYLAWIDASGLGIDNPQAYFESKGLGPSPGADFGDKQFVRINFACPRAYLEEAIKRLKA